MCETIARYLAYAAVKESNRAAELLRSRRWRSTDRPREECATELEGSFSRLPEICSLSNRLLHDALVIFFQQKTLGFEVLRCLFYSFDELSVTLVALLN